MKIFLVGLLLFVLFAVSTPASAQRKNTELENQLASYLGPFEIVDISEFKRIDGCKDPLASINFKGPNGRIISATITASSIEIVDDQGGPEKTDSVGDVEMIVSPPDTVRFTFDTNLIKPMSWRLITRPAKFITANYLAVQVEIHCPENESGKYRP